MDAPTTALLISIAFQTRLDIKLDINELIEQLRKSPPVVPEDLKINVKDEVKITENISASVNSTLKMTGTLSMIKSTNNPTVKELELIQAARGNRPYNSISNVQISYDENGSVTGASWTEN